MVASLRVDLTRLLAQQATPCLSLYLPTSRAFPDSQQNPVRFRNHVRELQRSLEQSYDRKVTQPLLERLQATVDDTEFWKYPEDGLAVFAAPGYFERHWLPRPVPELAIVADSFHVKPLVRLAQTTDAYQVLALSRGEIALYEGNRDRLEPVDLDPNVPRTLEKALGSEVTEPYMKVSSYGTGPGERMYHGHGSKKDEVDIDTERFFRVIDKAVLEHYSRPSELPLVLAALPEHQGVFRQMSGNPFLLERPLSANAFGLAPEELRRLSWEIVEPEFHRRTRALAESYRAAAAKGTGSDDVREVAKAAMEGRVDSVMVDADRHIRGRIADDGEVTFADTGHPEIDDVLDDIAVAVMQRGGRVKVVPRTAMPGDSGIAAIFRY